MNSASRVDQLHGKSVILDAGPLQTLLVLHYIAQSELSDTERGMHLIRETRRELMEAGVAAFWSTVATFGSHHYTQLGLAEALRFREHSSLKRHAEQIRNSALDAIRERELVEEYITSEECLEMQTNPVSLTGLTDAIHIHLLHLNADLVLLTDDCRLWQHAGESGDRIIVLNDLLSAYSE